MKKYLILAIFTLFLTACANTPSKDAQPDNLDYNSGINSANNPVVMNVELPVKKLVIAAPNHRYEFEVEIASTDAQRKVGLMNRKSLDDNKGMLFIFEYSGIINFWMKNTLVPLDIVFIDSNGYIKHIAKNAQPCLSSNDKDCLLYGSQESVKYVLEIKGGTADKLDIKLGEKVSWL